jgi:hypothetical protein
MDYRDELGVVATEGRLLASQVAAVVEAMATSMAALAVVTAVLVSEEAAAVLQVGEAGPAVEVTKEAEVAREADVTVAAAS